jgi:hypothetical protein
MANFNAPGGGVLDGEDKMPESGERACIIFNFVYTRPHADMVNKNTLKQRRS